jgi:hypothetical protein
MTMGSKLNDALKLDFSLSPKRVFVTQGEMLG